MQPIIGNVNLRLSYRVAFTRDIFSPANPLLRDVVADGSRRPAKVLFVVDRGLAEATSGLVEAIEDYCEKNSDALQLVCPPMTVPGGEVVKNSPLYAQMVLEAISEFGICRHSYVIAVGGGAVLDMAGYAAGTAHRGVRIIRVPSTVLSQNDSGVGVKNGINAFGKKNFVGTFAPPLAVLNDLRFLETLSHRDWRSGIVEAVKVALIKDAEFFDALESSASALTRRDMRAMAHLVHRCAELHVAHISTGGDPYESGSSRPLDFGHWAAHKLEPLTGFELRHGEAVAIGIALDSAYAWLKGMLPESDWRRIYNLLENLGFGLYVPELESPDLLQGLTEFREHLGGELSITLLAGIGRAVQVNHMDEEVIAEAVAELRQAAAGNKILSASIT